MDVKDIELFKTVICTEIKDHNYRWFRNRYVGFIGDVIAVFPLSEIVHVRHFEQKDGKLTEFITPFFFSELEPYHAREDKVKKAISKQLEIENNS